ncbi:MAG: response regulator [Verrucomicrobia bacterium]|jgi:nucleoside phosphorylase/CheY-like chemotaxis protein|nr:response regulator [Verrucomicrobiota bacterium]
MLNILVVDDSPEKVARIRKIIYEFDELDKNRVVVCGSLLDAKQNLVKTRFDLVILDIQIPNREGEDPVAVGGVNLLREIHSRNRYKKPEWIVGLTEFPDKLEAASGAFSGKLWTILLYDASNTQWEDSLRQRIWYSLDLKAGQTHGRGFSSDIGILTALAEPEFNAIEKRSDWQKCSDLPDDTTYFSARLDGREKRLDAVGAYLPQMGMPAAAVAATKMVAHFSPRYLAMAGITAGVKGRVELGDVIVPDPCWDWGSGKIEPHATGGILRPDPQPHRLDSHLKAILIDAQRDAEMLHRIWQRWPGKKPPQPPRLHVGPCASGAAVVANEQAVQSIGEHNRKLLGIDMEAYAVYHAAAHSPFPHPMAFSLKGVSDFADEYKDDSFREYAAFVSAELLVEIAYKYF